MAANSMRPTSFPLYGFVNAPCSKALLVVPGISTVGIALLPSHYRALLAMNWTQICGNRQIWRLLTGYLVYDSTVDLIYGSTMLYYFRTLERRWGARKYCSFLFAVSSLSAMLHFLLYHYRESVPYAVQEQAAGGLFAPLLSLYVYFAQDISGYGGIQAPSSVLFHVVLHVLVLKTLAGSGATRDACLLGLVSGILYRINFLWMQKWLRIPERLGKTFGRLYDFLFGSDSDPSQFVLMGATEETHEDMVFDHLLRNQSLSSQGNGSVRQRIGQGYTDVLQPTHRLLADFFEANQNPRHVNVERSLEGSPPEDKIQKLVEMGFTREAVVDALSNTNSNVQEATSILLSQ